MKRIMMATYVQGIQELNSFMAMLEDALKEAMPNVSLKRAAAYDWRGYQIKNFAGLKPIQYYCQVYLSAPQILIFQEYYLMSHYPFEVRIDLAAHHFFELPAAAQKSFLVNFIYAAVKEALDWNRSGKRQKIVDPNHI